MKRFASILLIFVLIFLLAMPALADAAPETEEAQQTEQAEDGTKTVKAIAAAASIGLVAAAGALCMAYSIGKSNDSIARQPEAEGSIKSNLMLGLVFIETAIIYALIVGILVIFVL